MKKIALILNWLTLVGIMIFSAFSWAASRTLDAEELAELGIMGGADGPTAIFISTEIDPLMIIIPLVIVLILLMNILVLTKK